MVVIRTPSDLDACAVERIAWDSEPIALDAGLLQRVDEARAAMVESLAAGERVYAVTTGTGYMARKDLTATEQAHQQKNLLMGRAVGSAPYLCRAETRALLTVRLVNFLSGHAGVTSGLCLYLVERINDGFVPAVPRRTMGSSGEVIALSHAFQTLVGVGTALEEDGLRPAAAALEDRGVEPYALQSKEGIALLAGAPATVALALSCRRKGIRLVRELLITGACAVDALEAPLDPYAEVAGRLSNDPELGRVIQALGALLDGSERTGLQSQAPVSFRVIPQVLAHLGRTLIRLGEDIERALGAVSDSPAFVDGHFVTTGGFHEIGLAAALDGLALALTQGAELAAQWGQRLLDHRFSGLPDQLTVSSGADCGPMVVRKRAVSVVNELRRLCVPATIGLADTSLGQEDAMTFVFEAAEKLLRVEELVREALACTLLVVRQAWSFKSKAPPPGLAGTVAAISGAVEPIISDRPLGPDVDRLIDLLENLGEDAVRAGREAALQPPSARPSSG